MRLASSMLWVAISIATRVADPANPNNWWGTLKTTNRISVLALPPLLHRVGRAVLPIVGGDRIGPRPVNYHLDALRESALAHVRALLGGA